MSQNNGVGSRCSQFLSNEYLEDDVNKFEAWRAASERSPAATLDRATGNHRPVSARYRETWHRWGSGTTVYDHRRQSFDRHAAYLVVAFVAGG